MMTKDDVIKIISQCTKYSCSQRLGQSPAIQESFTADGRQQSKRRVKANITINIKY